MVSLEAGNTFHLTLCPVLQTAGGAAGDHETERDGEWPFPMSALWGGAGLPGQLISVLQRLQEGKALLWLANWTCSVALHPDSQECTLYASVCVLVCMCVHVVSCVSWQEELGPKVEWPGV